MFSKLTLTEKRELHGMVLEAEKCWEALNFVEGLSVEVAPRFGFELSTGTFFLQSDECSLDGLAWFLNRELANQPKTLTNDEFMGALYKAHESASAHGADDGGDALERLLECGKLSEEQILAARAMMIAWGQGLL